MYPGTSAECTLAVEQIEVELFISLMDYRRVISGPLLSLNCLVVNRVTKYSLSFDRVTAGIMGPWVSCVSRLEGMPE